MLQIYSEMVEVYPDIFHDDISMLRIVRMYETLQISIPVSILLYIETIL
jgi:hypothetical protein